MSTQFYDVDFMVADGAHHKPHPFPYLAAIERLGLPPSQCLVFEDTLTGVRSGQAAGCPVVAIRSGITEHLPLLTPGDALPDAAADGSSAAGAAASLKSATSAPEATVGGG